MTPTIIYGSSFYGSALWDLFSHICDKLYWVWKVAVRVGQYIPATTHRYLVEPLSGASHAKFLLCSRILKFTDQLCNSNKPVVSLLARLFMEDMKTIIGKTYSESGRLWVIGSAAQLIQVLDKIYRKIGPFRPFFNKVFCFGNNFSTDLNFSNQLLQFICIFPVLCLETYNDHIYGHINPYNNSHHGYFIVIGHFGQM